MLKKVNSIFVAGTLKSVEAKTGVQANGSNYVAGKMVVMVDDNEIEARYYSAETTKAGKVNPRYANNQKIESYVGKRISFGGELRGRMYYDARSSQVNSITEISAAFVELASSKHEKDVAVFEFNGYVDSALVEKRNKEDEVYAYHIRVAQPIFGDEEVAKHVFTVAPEDRDIMIAVQEQYTRGKTISFNGVIEGKVVRTSVVSEVAFGEANVREFENIHRAFRIRGGSEPIVDGAYSREQMSKYEELYQEAIVATERQAKEDAEKGKTSTTPTVAKTDNASSFF